MKFNAAISQFKEEIMSSPNKKAISQIRPAIGKDITSSSYNHFQDGLATKLLGYATEGDRKETIRKKFEQAKKRAQHKDTVLFNEKNVVMKQRRNHFFAGTVKNIGKTKVQIKRD